MSGINNFEGTVWETVYAVLEIGGDISVTGCDDLGQYGMDSLNCIKLIVELEEKFGVTVPENKLGIDAVRTIDDVIGLVRQIINDTDGDNLPVCPQTRSFVNSVPGGKKGSDKNLPRLTGVSKYKFEKMKAFLDAEKITLDKRGPKPKLLPEDMLLATLEYFHKQRTYEYMGSVYNLSTSQIWRVINRVKAALLKNSEFSSSVRKTSGKASVDDKHFKQNLRPLRPFEHT